MHMASSVPQQHSTSCNRIDIISQVTIRAENNLFIFRETFNDLFCISRSHYYICHRFHSCRCIHIRDHRISRMCFHKLSKLICRTAVCQRTSCIQVGHQHLLVRTKHLCGFSHKMNATHHKNIRIGFGCNLSQSQTVPNVVGNILYFAFLVIVSQDYRILFFFQFIDGCFQINAFVYGLVNESLIHPFFSIHYILIFSLLLKRNPLLVIIAC